MSDRKALATFAAAARKDLAAVLGAHPLTKAVRLLAATIVGLKCALHGYPPFVPASAAIGPADLLGFLASWHSGLRRPVWPAHLHRASDSMSALPAGQSAQNEAFGFRE